MAITAETSFFESTKFLHSSVRIDTPNIQARIVHMIYVIFMTEVFKCIILVILKRVDDQY